MSDDRDIDFLGVQSRKRHHSEMSHTSGTTDFSPEPQYGEASSSEHHPFRRRSPPMRRYPGDGYDYRRPVMSSSDSNIGDGATDRDEEEVIDLTNEPDSSPREQRTNGTNLRARLDTVNVVNLATDDEEEEGDTSNNRRSSGSSDVQYVGTTTRDPSLPPSRPGPSRQHFPTNNILRMLRRQASLAEQSSNALMDLGMSLGRGFQRRMPWASLLRRPPQEVESFVIGDGPEGGIDLTVNLDMPGSEPPQDTYKPPSPPPEGFTRTMGEDDVVVCPNCDDELGKGDEIKQQIWVVKACGHVYCGECARNRSQAKAKLAPQRVKPFSRCQVDNCDKVVSAPKSMFQVYL